MAAVRMTMIEVAASDDVDRVRVAATTEADVQRDMREEGEVPDGDAAEVADPLGAVATLCRAADGRPA